MEQEPCGVTAEDNVSQEACPIDEFGPLPVVQPTSAAELADAVRQAAADGHAVYPVGGRTLLGYGQPPARPGIALDLRGLADVLDYPARDMTITVQAGITLAALREVLAAENQRLPLDAPHAERATLGGLLATNTSGPRRLGCGTARDYVIGISVVNDDGQEVKAGGRVVKNVAGYDLCKLYVGSLGTLGVISQVTLKLRPCPERTALLTLPCRAEEVGPLLDRLHGSRTRPVCVELLNPAAARGIDPEACGSSWAVLVGYEDNADAVTWQVQQLIRELCPGCQVSARVDGAAAPLWRRLVEFPARDGTALTFKANVLPSAVAGFCVEASRLREPLLLQAHAGNGIVIGHAAGELTAERAVSLVQALRELAVAGRGQVVVLSCPAGWKQRLSVWGPGRSDWALMRTVKEKLDPRRLFNPGRFVDGI
jgi:glycolate oxidase FAD binding subunit